ncbi:MAG: hypothetical protein BMS9Abin05_1547 [Rhodothermia bacterium]|nr:MAG: hypothetical protein BMS9Abin05_1547 [Rhodothermia bacterium]
MKNHRDQPDDQTIDGKSEDLNRESEWTWLHESLKASLQEMVADESEHVRHEFLTDNILRAVRTSSVSQSWFDELWPGLMRSWVRSVVVVGILLVFLLAAYNARQVSSDLFDRSTTERVLGLYQVTVASAYDLDLESISR